MECLAGYVYESGNTRLRCLKCVRMFTRGGNVLESLQHLINLICKLDKRVHLAEKIKQSFMHNFTLSRSKSQFWTSSGRSSSLIALRHLLNWGILAPWPVINDFAVVMSSLYVVSGSILSKWANVLPSSGFCPWKHLPQSLCHLPFLAFQWGTALHG